MCFYIPVRFAIILFQFHQIFWTIRLAPIWWCEKDPMWVYDVRPLDLQNPLLHGDGKAANTSHWEMDRKVKTYLYTHFLYKHFFWEFGRTIMIWVKDFQTCNNCLGNLLRVHPLYIYIWKEKLKKWDRNSERKRETRQIARMCPKC